MNYPALPLPTLEQLLQSLVRCSSVNPGKSARVEPPFGEARLIDWLASFLGPWADSVEIQEVRPHRPNIIVRFEGLDRSRSYAFEAHADTVGTDGMTIDPWAAEIRDGRLYGRGACDTKGPMAAMLLAILRHLKTHGRPPVTWFFISTCDEELGGAGAKYLMDSGFRCDGIVVGEPTDLTLIDRHKGAIRLKIDLYGRAGHSAHPEHGTNAIHAAADFIRHLRMVVDGSSTTSGFEPGIGPPTLSIGTIRGGDQVNRIPDFATMEVDLRIPPGIPDSPADLWIAAASDATRSAFPDIRIEVEVTQRYPAFQLPADSPFRRLTALLSADSDCAPARYATNAGFFAESGLPCIIFGPGSVVHAHTAQESIELSTLETACEQLVTVIRQSGNLSTSPARGVLSKYSSMQ